MQVEHRLFKKWVLLEIEGLNQYPKHLVHLDLLVDELDALIDALLKIQEEIKND